MSKFLIVAFSGPAGAGKSTAADSWPGRHRYERWSFATPLKHIIHAADPLLDPESHARLQWGIGHNGEGFVKQKFPEYRRLLQEVGEGIRSWDPQFFARIAAQRVEGAFLKADCPGVLIDDLRLPVELMALKAVADKHKDAELLHIRIERPGIEVLGHPTETALRFVKPHYTVVNDGDQVDLSEKLRSIYEEVALGTE